MIIWELVIAGAIGGLARVGYSALKSAENRKPVNLWYFLVSVLTSAFLGAVIGSIFTSETAVSALIGYIGTDILDNVIKGVVPKTIGV